MSVTIEPLARTQRPSGEAVDHAAVSVTFGRRGLSATTLIDSREAREIARILTAAANAAEALEPVIVQAVPAPSPEPAKVPAPFPHAMGDTGECVSWCRACRENIDRGLNPDGTSKVDQPEDGGAR